jgi:hypothetical protein
MRRRLGAASATYWKDRAFTVGFAKLRAIRVNQCRATENIPIYSSHSLSTTFGSPPPAVKRLVLPFADDLHVLILASVLPG